MIKNKLISIVISTVLISIIITILTNYESQPAEQLNVEIGAGFDIEKSVDGEVIYEIPRSVYVFEGENKRYSKVLIGRGYSIGSTRENRHLKADKKNIGGLEKVYLLGEDYARYGIRGAIDIIFNNPLVNDTPVMVVCKGKTLPILEHKIPNYSSSADFIERLVKNQYGLNFFSDEYNAKNIYVRLDSEGRSIVLPYIELIEGEIKITGLAIFKEGKMVYKLDMTEATVLNMLRPEKGKSTLVLEKNSTEFVNYSGEANPKIKCFKEGDKYSFIININIKGDMIANTLYLDMINSTNAQKEFERLMADKIQKQSDEFINKMKNEIKVDCLELGRVAAAKYGRRTGTDWNSVVCDSNIKVNVKVKVDKVGRGIY